MQSNDILPSMPDPLLAYRDALEDRFSELLNDRFNLVPLNEDSWNKLTTDEKEEYQYLCEEWADTRPSEPLTYTMADIEEGWGPDFEEGIETMNHAMDKDIYEENRRKEQFLMTHFGEEND